LSDINKRNDEVIGGGTMMKRELAMALLACWLAACAQPSPPEAVPPSPPTAAVPASPQPVPPSTARITSAAQIAPGRWDVRRVLCSDLLGASDDDRASAVMFYYGYLAAKADIRVIDVRQIDSNVKKVIDRCAAAPDMTVPEAFREAIGKYRGGGI
jgi:hypothetical protein